MARLVFHLVHGTLFYFLTKPRVPWLRCGKPSVPWVEEHSRLRIGLSQRLEALGHQVEFRVVDWSGRNRHGARLAAAKGIRRSVARAPGDAVNFLVAHSHGGNACLLALKEAEGLAPKVRSQEESKSEGQKDPQSRWADRVTGVAYLSTPFLVVRRAEWALSATAVWWVAALFAVMLTADTLLASRLATWGATLLLGAAVGLPVVLAIRRYRNTEKWSQAPNECRVPALIVRCPGDEASSGLGLVAFLARVVFLLEQWAAWPVRWMKRNFVGYVLGGTAILLAIVLPIAFSSTLQAWWSEHWHTALLVIFGPLLLGVPIRVLLYGLAYGIDLLGLPLVASISAETTPMGHWTTMLVSPPDSEERRSAHSGIYDLERVHDDIGNWVKELVTRGSTP